MLTAKGAVKVYFHRWEGERGGFRKRASSLTFVGVCTYTHLVSPLPERIDPSSAQEFRRAERKGFYSSPIFVPSLPVVHPSQLGVFY